MVGRCIVLLKQSPILGDMLIFRVVGKSSSNFRIFKGKMGRISLVLAKNNLRRTWIQWSARKRWILELLRCFLQWSPGPVGEEKNNEKVMCFLKSPKQNLQTWDHEGWKSVKRSWTIGLEWVYKVIIPQGGLAVFYSLWTLQCWFDLQEQDSKTIRSSHWLQG